MEYLRYSRCMDRKELQHFLDGEGKLISWPAKSKKQIAALEYLVDQLEWEKQYSEAEINELLTQFHTFHDPALLRRELYMKKLLDRRADGSRYWKTARQLPNEWNTKRLFIRDTLKDEVPELQKIYDECAYIGEWTGYDNPRKDPMMSEYKHKTLPPDGKKELHRLQTIMENISGQIIGYLISYHGFPDPKTFWIAVLAIRPSFQRKKFGKEVVKELEQRIVSLRSYDRMGTSVGLGNEPALRFWSASGFTETLKTEKSWKTLGCVDRQEQGGGKPPCLTLRGVGLALS